MHHQFCFMSTETPRYFVSIIISCIAASMLPSTLLFILLLVAYVCIFCHILLKQILTWYYPTSKSAVEITVYPWSALNQSYIIKLQIIGYQTVPKLLILHEYWRKYWHIKNDIQKLMKFSVHLWRIKRQNLVLLHYINPYYVFINLTFQFLFAINIKSMHDYKIKLRQKKN